MEKCQRQIKNARKRRGKYVGYGVEILCRNTTKDQLAINIMACKLEIGEHQILAHEENESWVSDEIPNYYDIIKHTIK